MCSKHRNIWAIIEQFAFHEPIFISHYRRKKKQKKNVFSLYSISLSYLFILFTSFISYFVAILHLNPSLLYTHTTIIWHIFICVQKYKSDYQTNIFLFQKYGRIMIGAPGHVMFYYGSSLINASFGATKTNPPGNPNRTWTRLCTILRRIASSVRVVSPFHHDFIT